MTPERLAELRAAAEAMTAAELRARRRAHVARSWWAGSRLARLVLESGHA